MLSNIPTVNFQGFVSVIRSMPRQMSILCLGDHGIGKSAAVKLAAELEQEPCYDIRLAGKEPGDVIGVMALSEDGLTSRHRPPEWWRPFFDPNCKATLFLDELNRAHKDVRQGIFQLVLDRELNGYKLPDGVRIVVAGNEGDDYDVDEFDMAFATRYWVCRLEPDVEEWLALDGIHPFVHKFIARHRDMLDSKKKDDLAPCRRGWSRLSDILNESEVEDPKHPMLMVWASGCIGREAGVAFAEFAKTLRLVSGKDILDDDERAKASIGMEEVSLLTKLNKEVFEELKKRYSSEEARREFMTSSKKKEVAVRNNLLAYMLDQPIETFYQLFHQLIAMGKFGDVVRSFTKDPDRGEEFLKRLKRSMGRIEKSK